MWLPAEVLALVTERKKLTSAGTCSVWGRVTCPKPGFVLFDGSYVGDEQVNGIREAL